MAKSNSRQKQPTAGKSTKSQRRIAQKDETRTITPTSWSEFFEPIDGPELFFGLVGAIGVDLSMVRDTLATELKKVGYESVFIHVTDAFQYFKKQFDIFESPLEKRFNSRMNAGNELREKLDRNDALALMSVAEIRHKRRALTKSPDTPAKDTAYILSQFKRPEEIETLRTIYGRAFIQVSAYCPEQTRLESLANKIAESHHREHRTDAYKSAAFELISRDHAEEDHDFGQRLRETFSLADVVIDARNKSVAKQSCQRFIRAYFGDPFITPTKDEYGTYAARIAALRSADLARQVGAVTMTSKGEVITMGCNEVPRAGGGTYWEGDDYDSRDFQLGHDSSVAGKKTVLEDAFRRMKTAGWLSTKHRKRDIPDLVDEALWSGPSAVMKDSQLMDVLEFGRSVHAEMVAVTDAARLGRPLKGATLYCTTFPCHICARHIVSSGIERVVYVEPYPKSLAAQLYPDSIHVEGTAAGPGTQVTFEAFIGIAPPRYSEIFRRSKDQRKEKTSGKAIEWDRSTAKPLLRWYVPTYLYVEASTLAALYALLEKKDLPYDYTHK